MWCKFGVVVSCLAVSLECIPGDEVGGLTRWHWRAQRRRGSNMQKLRSGQAGSLR